MSCRWHWQSKFMSIFIGLEARLQPNIGDLGVTYTVHLWLIGKCVVDFLLLLIELFSPALTVEALWANIGRNCGFWKGILAVFTRSAITRKKVNRFEWNLNHSEYIVGGWPRQIFNAIRAVATAEEPGEILFVFCQVSNAWFRRFPVGQISRNFENNMSIGVVMTHFRTKFLKIFTVRCRFSPKR